MHLTYSLGLLAAFALSTATATAKAEKENRVLNFMNIGDSIVARHCWRGFINDYLVEAGFGDDVEFVGNQNRTIEKTPWHTIKTCAFKHNETYSDRHDGIPKYSTKKVAAEIDDWIEAIPRPDIVNIMLGANDVMNGIQPNETEIYFGQIIKSIRKFNGNAVIIMTKPMPRKGRQKKIDRISAGIPKWVDHWNSTESPIYIADASIQGGYDPEMELRDNIHPDTAGEYWLAGMYTPVVIRAIRWIRWYDMCGKGECEEKEEEPKVEKVEEEKEEQEDVKAADEGIDDLASMRLAIISDYQLFWGQGLFMVFVVSGAMFACWRYR